MPMPSSALIPYGWDAEIAAAVEPGCRPGRVVRVEYGAAIVRTADGEVVADWTSQTSRAAGIDVSPVVGDWVGLVDDDEEGTVVAQVVDRRSTLSRHDPADDHTEQVLAANVDVIFVVAAIDHELNVRRLDRMLSMAWGSGARPVLVLTKADLAEGELAEAQLRDVCGDAPWLVVNGLTLEGLDEVRESLAGGTAVFVGPSGVGKSTLVNALAGETVMEIGAVRDRDGKGRHTTTTRELWPVLGGVVIDTPGIRGVQLWDPVGGVDRHFADLADLAMQCRFADCAHSAEPGCAVTSAVEAGQIDRSRLDRWRALTVEANEWEVREVERERDDRKAPRSRRGY